jgi:hypothetical protein
MFFANMQPINYDVFMDLTSCSVLDGSAYKTWFFKGDHTSELSTQDPQAFQKLMSSHYAGYRSVDFKKVSGVEHTIELQEFDIHETGSVGNFISYAIDPLLEYTKANSKTLQFSINQNVKNYLSEQKLLKPLYRYVMNRDLTLNPELNQITHTKTNELKLSHLKAKYLKSKLESEPQPEQTGNQLRLR